MVVVQTLIAKSAVGFELTVTDLGPWRAAICAAGEFDLAAREALTEVLRDQEEAHRRVVRLDLSQVTFLDCSCLGVLVTAHQRLLELHGLLVLTGVEAQVARMLRLTGLDDYFFTDRADHDPASSVLMAVTDQFDAPAMRLTELC